MSSCIAKRPEGWVERWDFNDAGCYPSPESARAAAPTKTEDEAAEFCLFAYEFFPLRFAVDGTVAPVDVARVFDMSFRPLPPGGVAPDFEFLGYDAVERWPDHEPTVSRALGGGFGCSPLSCNCCSPEHPVNRHCLLTEWTDAVATAQRFAKDQPEPGCYYIFGVWRKR